jgi:hypothetical protein
LYQISGNPWGKTMTVLIVSIVLLLLGVFGLGYFWLFRTRDKARSRTYAGHNRAAAPVDRWSAVADRKRDRS